MSQSEEYSWVKIRKIILVTCLVLVIIYLPVFISWRVYQYRAVSELVQAIESFNDQETDEALEKVKSRNATELALPRLIELLESNSEIADSRALSRVFYALGPAANSRLLEKIQPSENINIRVRAIYILRTIGRSQIDDYEFQRIVHSLVQALDDENRDIRFSAAQAISHIDPSRAGETLPVLVELLKDLDTGIRVEVIYLIGLFGNRAEGVLPELLIALKDPDSLVRGIAASTIVKIGNSDIKVINGLIEVLSDENPNCRSRAAYALGQFGPQAKPAVPALLASLNMLQDVEQEVPHNSLQESTRRSLRRSLIDALGDIGHASPEVIQALITTLNDKRYSISRESAAIALGKLGPKAVGAVPDLVKVRDEAKIDSKLSSETSMEIEFENRLGLEAAIALEQIDLKRFNRALNESNTEAQ
ncbi:HEAT repeat domain-containing protein [uncultured Gimesia sp.]|uniref:HEAT repeat domain-containing protein n=1 Tax=uncultured Gimesia sp. TaxID=1678688 RepID=UPI00261EB39D|nr:HEAT repeat domain-containing protein [uncultured Gimesia sp.]